MQTKRSITITVLLMAASLAQAGAAGNPMDPSYYVGQPRSRGTTETGSGTRSINGHEAPAPSYVYTCDLVDQKWLATPRVVASADVDTARDFVDPNHASWCPFGNPKKWQAPSAIGTTPYSDAPSPLHPTHTFR
jgi:hypothetical protein